MGPPPSAGGGMGAWAAAAAAAGVSARCSFCFLLLHTFPALRQPHSHPPLPFPTHSGQLAPLGHSDGEYAA